MKRFRYLLIFFIFLLIPAFRAQALSSSELRVRAVPAAAVTEPGASLSGEDLSLLLPGAEGVPGHALTRAEFSSALYRFLSDNALELPDCGVRAFSDSDKCGNAAASVEYLLRGGVLGTDRSGLFHPQRKITCGEAALAVGRLELLARPRRSGQPASSLPVTSPKPTSVLSGCCMMGHSNVVGLDMLVHTEMDIIAMEGISSIDFLSRGDLSFGLNGSGYAADGLRRRQYSVVYIMLGTNDMVQGLYALDSFQRHMSDIAELTACYQPSARICLLAITPVGLDVPLYTEEILCYNRSLKELSRMYGVDYLDIFTPLSVPGGANRPGLARNDGLHYGTAGYRTILNVLLTHFPEA